jgi:serine/threonine-protein kinase RsbW
MTPGSLTVRVEVMAAAPATPDYDSFAWQVLSTLATAADAEASDGRFAVSVTMQPETSGAGL